MEAAAEALAEFGIPFEADVVSAHRMPTEMIRYGADGARARTARHHRRSRRRRAPSRHARPPSRRCPSSVFPCRSRPWTAWIRCCPSCRCPPGVPVATVSIAGARNAGLLAVRMLASGTDDLAVRLRAELLDFAQELNDVASRKGANLRQKVSEVFADGNVRLSGAAVKDSPCPTYPILRSAPRRAPDGPRPVSAERACARPDQARLPADPADPAGSRQRPDRGRGPQAGPHCPAGHADCVGTGAPGPGAAVHQPATADQHHHQSRRPRC